MHQRAQEYKRKRAMMTESSAALPSADVIRRMLIKELAAVLKTSEAEIDTRKDFDDYGLDSTDAVIIAGLLEEQLAIELDPELLLRNRSVDQVTEWLEQNCRQANDAQIRKFSTPTGGVDS
jgi:acyl carrier protein